MVHHALSPKYTIAKAIAVHCLFFALISWLLLPNMDIDMFENFAWGQSFEWGTFKHPTFFVWITRIWFSLAPVSAFSYFVLSYLNAAVGLAGILCLANLLINNNTPVQQNNYLFLVLGFSLLGLPYNLYAAVFNADSILISLWPWTTYAFFAAFQAPAGRKKWLWMLALSLLAAASILGKYFSAVLLLSLLIISLEHKPFRLWYKTAYPYVCFCLFVALLLPHIFWEYRMSFPFRDYYSRYLNVSWFKLFKHTLTFMLTGIYFYALSWIAWIYLKIAADKQAEKPAQRVNNRIIVQLCFLPVALSILFSLVLGIDLKDRWAIPAWFALPICLANYTAIVQEFRLEVTVLKRCWLFIVAFVCFALTTTFLYSNRYLSAHQDYVEARKEMVDALAVRFASRFPQQHLSWVAGTAWPDHLAPVSFYLPNHPRALPGFPNQMPALVNPYNHWNLEYGALICGKKYAEPEAVIQDCVTNTKAWLRNTNRDVQVEILTYHAKGWRWRFNSPPEKQIAVFWVKPQINGV